MRANGLACVSWLVHRRSIALEVSFRIEEARADRAVGPSPAHSGPFRAERALHSRMIRNALGDRYYTWFRSRRGQNRARMRCSVSRNLHAPREPADDRMIAASPALAPRYCTQFAAFNPAPASPGGTGPRNRHRVPQPVGTIVESFGSRLAAQDLRKVALAKARAPGRSGRAIRTSRAPVAGASGETPPPHAAHRSDAYQKPFDPTF